MNRFLPFLDGSFLLIVGAGGFRAGFTPIAFIIPSGEVRPRVRSLSK